MSKVLMTLSDETIPQWLEQQGIPGIVDLHVHFMPDRVQQKVWRFFDRLVETGAPAWPVTYRFTDEERIRILRQMGVRAFTTLNYAHRPGMAAWLNEYSTALAREHGDVIHSGTFFPEPEVEQVVADALAAGVRVFKVHVQIGGFSPADDRLAPAWRSIEDAGTPVVIHCGDGPHRGEHTGIAPVRQLLDRHPDLTLIIAHAGLPDYAGFAALAREHPNVYLDTTMVGTRYMEQVAPIPTDFPEMLASLPGKMVLGTDFPTIPYPYSHQLDVLESWDLGRDWLADVLWHTPRGLIGECGA